MSEKVKMTDKFLKAIYGLPVLGSVQAGSLRRFFCYAAVGIIVFFINAILLTCLIRLYRMPDLYAVIISYIVASMCHFIINNKVTFKGSTESFKRRLLGHLSVSAINYPVGITVSYVVLTFVIRNEPIASLISMFFTFVVGITVLNRYVYKTNKKKGV